MLTVLFAPFDASGHFNSCISVGEVLIKRGHRVVFLAPNSWCGKLKKLGFEEAIYAKSDASLAIKDNWIASYNANTAPYCQLSPLDQQRAYGRRKKQSLIEIAKNTNDSIALVVANVNPDLIIIDNLSLVPSLALNKNIPWIRIVSSQCLYLLEAYDAESYPPSASGLSINCPKEEWRHFRTECAKLFEDICNDWSNYIVSMGLPPLAHLQTMPVSPYANFYMCPLELDYHSETRPIPSKLHRFDNFVRSGVSDDALAFELPKEFLQKSGKLIYFSLGSIACVDVSLMNRLLNILRESPHKFIVSKGPLSDQIHLSDNMWGEASVPQTKVLEMVDMVITHGGNNTINETFFYGKPMIVMPIYSDQFDNAQRVEECGYGRKINAYHCTDMQLLEAIETVLNDNEMKLRISRASERIKRDQNEDHNRMVHVIETVAKCVNKK